MSTRAVYTFKDNEHSFGYYGEPAGQQTFHVYKHHDGNPAAAYKHIQAGMRMAWVSPRFEADEMAAAFVAANKPVGGGVRLMNSGDLPRDVEWHYVITVEPQTGCLGLMVEIFASQDGKEKALWKGNIQSFVDLAEDIEEDFYRQIGG